MQLSEEIPSMQERFEWCVAGDGNNDLKIKLVFQNVERAMKGIPRPTEVGKDNHQSSQLHSDCISRQGTAIHMGDFWKQCAAQGAVPIPHYISPPR